MNTVEKAYFSEILPYPIVDKFVDCVDGNKSNTEKMTEQMRKTAFILLLNDKKVILRNLNLYFRKFY